MISADVNVDQGKENGCTPLIVAAEQTHDSVVSALISAGASVDTEMGNAWCRVRVSVLEEHSRVVRA
eukprot:COSAG06_NODE_52839_length_303_cov_1.176471_1_plen_66_part_10